METKIAIAIVVVVILFSGCLSGAETDIALRAAQSSEPPLSGEIVEPAPGVKIDASRGAILGRVFDDKSFPLREAHVSLLQTPHFTETDKEGRYSFLNLTPGPYVVSASYPGFQFNEAEVTVEPGNATQYDVFLVPSEGSGAGYRPHVHDYWGDRTEVLIMDRDVDFRNVEKGSEFGGPPYNTVVWGVAYPTANVPMALNIPSDPEDPRIIYPGTREIQVTLTWDATDSTVHSVALQYLAPVGSPKTLERKPSPATWTIAVDKAEMTDRGHQWFTLWSFNVLMGTDPAQGANARPAILLGPFHAAIKVVKGEILPEPPHVDHWQGQMQKNILNLSKVNVRSNLDVVDRTVYVGPTLDSIVPPGTKMLRIFFLWEYDQLNGTGPMMDNVLTWKTAGDDPTLTRAENFRKAPAKASGNQWKLYEIDVLPSETDAFYQTRSLWKFLPAQKDFESHPRDYEMRPYRIRLQVTAIRDADFAADKA